MRSVERPVLRVRNGSAVQEQDRLAPEAPLEIRICGPGRPLTPVAVTLRTPGHDEELAAGFLLSEGILAGTDEIVRAHGDQRNTVVVELNFPFAMEGLQRRFAVSSSCGLCGRASLERLSQEAPTPQRSGQLDARTLRQLPRIMRDAQRGFDATGGLHAAALFSRDGELLVLREDVGRHNALDKVIGRKLLDDALPLRDAVLLVSGRVSFELVQKAAMAGIPFLCAISAPSSLAVEAAERLGLTLVGFLRGDDFNVYAHPEGLRLGVTSTP